MDLTIAKSDFKTAKLADTTNTNIDANIDSFETAKEYFNDVRKDKDISRDIKIKSNNYLKKMRGRQVAVFCLYNSSIIFTGNLAAC